MLTASSEFVLISCFSGHRVVGKQSPRPSAYLVGGIVFLCGNSTGAEEFMLAKRLACGIMYGNASHRC